MSAEASTELAAIDLYGAELLRAATEPAGDPVLHMVDEHGERTALALERYVGRAAAEEDGVLERTVAPVLDIGCGPGRHVVALGRRGVAAVGLDISPPAVWLARRRGASVIEGSIFSRVPHAGQWGSALLLDGNIGIGGEPAQLLARVSTLLRRQGVILVEVEPPGAALRSANVHLLSARARSRRFRWARLGIDDIDAVAADASLTVSEHWHAGGRWFAALGRPAGGAHDAGGARGADGAGSQARGARL